MSGQSAKRDPNAERRVESALSELFEATQQLFERLAEDAPVAEIDAAYGRRSHAFETLREVADAGPLKTPRAIRVLDKIRELDAEMLEGARQLASELRADRSTLTRTRRAMTAHTAKERAEPRLLAVRA